MAQEITWAVITPSYSLDLERCRLLCRSMDAFLTGPWHHYIVVDPPDYGMFQSLAGKRRTVMIKDDILPQGLRYGGKIPFMRLGRFWVSWKHGLVFGWQMQQYIKLLMATCIKQDGMLFCDSDLFFLRPFNITTLSRGNTVRYFTIKDEKASQNRDIAASVRLLGLDPRNIEVFWGPDQMVTWHRPTVIELQTWLSELHRKPWHEAIGSKTRIAEYHLYGCYVNYIRQSNPNLHVDPTIYCKALWHKETADSTNIEDFCSDLGDSVAVCIQSLISFDIKRLEMIFDNSLRAFHTRQS